MKTNFSSNQILNEVLRLVLVSLILGLILTVFFKASVVIENTRSIVAYLVFLPLLLPLLLYLQIRLERKNKNLVKSVKESLLTEPVQFISAGYVFGFTLLGYILGASVGREGACVVIAQGLQPKKTITSINWQQILASIGFAGALGYFWLGPLFYLEVFVLNLKKPLNSKNLFMCFLGSFLVCKIMRILNVPYFSFSVAFNESWLMNSNFYLTLMILTVLSCLGSHFFKWIYFAGKNWLDSKTEQIRLLCCAVFGLLLTFPTLQIFQGLSLNGVHLDFISKEHSLFLALGKLIATAISLSFGFMGGEFVPALLIGSNLGQLAGSSTTEFILLGSGLGFFIFFGCLTRLFWVCILATALHFGWQIGIIFSIVLAISLKFCGRQSVYFNSEKN